MESREALKKVVHFANWEYKEKRPKSVKVLRLKSKSMITLGVLPEFQMRTIGPIIYLVVSDQGDELMIYFFNRNGERTGGQHYELSAKFMKKLERSTTVKYQLPKKEPKDFIDATYQFQQEFAKIHQKISHKLSIFHKYPYTILVDKNLPFTLTHNFGCKRIKKELHVPFQIKEKNYLELLANVEWFYSYLSSIIPIPKEKQNSSLLYEIAFVLSVAFNPKFQEQLSTLKLKQEKTQIAIISLKKPVFHETLLSLLQRYFSILKVLTRYRIKVSTLEFEEIISYSYEIFNVNSDVHAFFMSEREDLADSFYFTVFTKARTRTKQAKSYFLSMLFGLNILSTNQIMEPPYTLAEAIKSIDKFVNVPEIYESIGRLEPMVSEILSKYILRFIECKMYYAIQDESLDINLELKNISNYVLRDFTYDLDWKPKNKVELIHEDQETKAKDLHENVKKHYLFTINRKGSITFSCYISFINPVYQDMTINKVISLQKVILE